MYFLHSNFLITSETHVGTIRRIFLLVCDAVWSSTNLPAFRRNVCKFLPDNTESQILFHAMLLRNVNKYVQHCMASHLANVQSTFCEPQIQWSPFTLATFGSIQSLPTWYRWPNYGNTWQCENWTVHCQLCKCTVQSAETGGRVGQLVHNHVNEEGLEVG